MESEKKRDEKRRKCMQYLLVILPHFKYDQDIGNKYKNIYKNVIWMINSLCKGVRCNSSNIVHCELHYGAKQPIPDSNVCYHNSVATMVNVTSNSTYLLGVRFYILDQRANKFLGDGNDNCTSFHISEHKATLACKRRSDATTQRMAGQVLVLYWRFLYK